MRCSERTDTGLLSQASIPKLTHALTWSVYGDDDGRTCPCAGLSVCGDRLRRSVNGQSVCQHFSPAVICDRFAHWPTEVATGADADRALD